MPMITHSFRWVTLRVCVTRRETAMLSKWLICCFKDHMLTSVPFRLPLHLVSSPSSTSIIPSSLSPTRSPFLLLFPSLVAYSFPLSLFYPFSHFKFLPCPLLLHSAHIPTRQLNPNVPSLFWLSPSCPPWACPPAMSDPWLLSQHLAMTRQCWRPRVWPPLSKTWPEMPLACCFLLIFLNKNT